MNKSVLGKQLLKNKKFLILAVLAAVGILLVLTGGGDDKAKEQSKTESEATVQLEQYREQLRQDIVRLCEQVGGVSNVTVAVSLECGFE